MPSVYESHAREVAAVIGDAARNVENYSAHAQE
jgi:hypothetical protein